MCTCKINAIVGSKKPQAMETVVSLAEHLQIVAIMLELSHWYSSLCPASEESHITVLKTRRRSSLAMIPI